MGGDPTEPDDDALLAQVMRRALLVHLHAEGCAYASLEKEGVLVLDLTVRVHPDELAALTYYVKAE